MKLAAQLLLTFLLNAIWQVALITAGAVLCDYLLKNVAARYRHFLWIVALLLAVCFPILSSAYLIKTPDGSKSADTRRAEPVAIARITSADVESIETSEPALAVPAAERVSQLSPLHINPALAAALITVFSLFVSYRGLNILRAWRRTRVIADSVYELALSETIRIIIEKCRRITGERRARIVCSAQVAVPVTIGAIKPLVVLPRQLLHELDDELLTSAIGHELIHCARKDYLVNLICEVIYLPLSFHPAAALIRRRIKQTRELSCDESVVDRLLKPESYARSLVRLVSTAPIRGRLVVDTTIGIAESDHLEVRIMSLLRKTESAPRRNVLLLLAAVLLLAAPCAAAASFALRLDIYPEAPLGLSASAAQQTQSRKQDQTEATLKQQLQQLPEQAQGAADSRRAEIEDRLGEAQNNLKPQQQLLQQYDQTKGFAVLSEVAQAYQKLLMDATGQETDQKARLIRKVEPQYPDDARARGIEGTVVLAFTIDRDGVPQNIVVKGSLDPVLDQAAVAAVRQWRFEPALKNGQPVAKTVTVEVYFNPDPSRMQQQSDERARALERELVERARKQQQEIDQLTATQDKEAYEKAKDQFRELQERAKTLDEEARAKRAWDEAQNNYQGDVLRVKQRQLEAEIEREDRLRGAGLDAAKWAKITITQAIQIATSKYPGTVLQARLFGERADQVFYQIMVANGDDINYVWVSAIDGQITQTEAAKRRRE